MSNKDEALRAKGVAEDCMRKSDFTTARRLAVKAQKMDETLENISHMILVCDVHCAALDQAPGEETDWYKILQVEYNADENTIKKQYRKFALHLHPDKNTLPGAEAAFKLIGEAQRVLLDKDKRRIHDMKRKPVKRPAPTVPSYQPQHAPPPRAFYTAPVFQSNVAAERNSFTAGLRPENQPKPQAPPPGFGESRTFWASCGFCRRKHECVKEFLHKQVMCPGCGKQSIAYQTDFQAPPAQPTFSFYQQSKVPTQEAGMSAPKKPESSVRFSPRKEASKGKGSGSSAEHINGHGKRKKMVESTDSFSSEGSYDLEEVATGGQHSRRSVRSKQNVCDDGKKEVDAETVEDNVFAKTLPNGRNRKGKAKDDQVGNSRGSRACHATKGSSSGSASNLEISECADPDFTNFEKLREENCFKAGQIWAMYDDMDQMPRYYAIIRKVIRHPKFLLKITWIEHKPDDERAKGWAHRELPVSVGKYQLGGDDNTSETPSFSHLISCRIESKEDIVCVYPRMGEIWALFKNWDINWPSASGRHEYKYEFVEILSEYAQGSPIRVALLRKVKGFASVFHRVATGGRSNTLQIPAHELLRFSHSIPSTKLTGKERSGVPVGSYELDTAALPQMIEEEGKEEAVPVVREAAKSNQARPRPRPSSEPDCIVIPNYEFHDFSAERSEGKFTAGQIWSLNCKEEGLPKYYAKIQKVEWRPVFKLQINKLVLESLPETVTQWRDKRMPVSCGKFTLKVGQSETLTQVTGFSHQIKAQEINKNKYSILPKTGDIWAMYKNWSDAIKAGSLKKWGYEVVEVLDDDESHIEVMMLERVEGFSSVFKEKVEGGMDVRKTIPRSELLRFSHYVPAFRLTGERGGALRGYVELDSTALSRNLLRS